jgi:hypothetical protein
MATCCRLDPVANGTFRTSRDVRVESVMRSKGTLVSRSDYAAAARSSLSAPRATIIRSGSGSGRCNAFASSHGARIKATAYPRNIRDGASTPIAIRTRIRLLAIERGLVQSEISAAWSTHPDDLVQFAEWSRTCATS